MIDRIRKLMENEKMSSSQFADEIDLQRSSLSHVLSGRNKPSLDFVMKIKQRFKEVNLGWLIFGNGDMFDRSNVVAQKTNVPLKIPTQIGTQQETIDFTGNRLKVDMVGDEDKAPYGDTNMNDSKSGFKTERVMIFYSNGTFEEYVKS